MKLKLKKNIMKNLSLDDKTLPIYATGKIAGGSVGTIYCESRGCPITQGPGESDELPWNPIP